MKLKLVPKLELKLIILGILLLCKISYAGAILTSINVLYLSKTVEGENLSSTEHTQNFMSYSLSYLFTSRIILGGMYISETTDSGVNIEKTTGAGPSIGILIGNWALESALLSQMEFKPSSSSQVKWQEGTGYQFSLSYLGLGTQGFFWGFQWSYRVIDYKKYFDGITVSQTTRKDTETFPQVKLGYAF